MAAINNNKESFELLRASFDSNSDSEASEIIFPAKKKRFRRRLKNNPSTQVHNECPCRIRTVGLTLFCVLLVCWLVVLTWVAVVLHSELNRLASHVSKVVAGNQGVPDALQKCHTLSKDLQKNQTYIMNRLSGFAHLLTNFSLEMTEVKSGLQAVQNQLKSSPDLVNIPRLIQDLSASVASFGSQIRDLNSTVSTLKEQNGKLDNVVVNLVSNLTETKMKLVEVSKAKIGKNDEAEKALAVVKEAILARVSQVSGNLSEINTTLSNKLKWTADDRAKDRKLLENLQEMNDHVAARVKTLEGYCAKESETKLSASNVSNSQQLLQSKEKPEYSSLSSTDFLATGTKASIREYGSSVENHPGPGNPP